MSFFQTTFERSPSRITFLLAATLSWVFFPPTVAAQGQLSGPWEGAIEIPGMPLKVQIELEGGGESLQGTIDIPAQNAKGLALDQVSRQGTKVRFSIAGIPGNPTFNGVLKDQEIRGDFQQGGQRFPFTLRRKAEEAAAKPPVPYDEEEVAFKNGVLSLAGTLTLPRGKGPFPALLLLSGSGPQDRDATLFGHKIFQVIADHLTRAGIAVLRVDDRGVGGSSGQIQEATLSDFADDALAGVRYLKARTEVNGRRIGLLGHSEGGTVAPLAASRSKDVAFLVLLAAPAVGGDEVLFRQNELLLGAHGAGRERIESQLASLREIFGILRKEGDHEEELLQATERQITMQTAGMDLPPATRKAQVDAAMSLYLSPWFNDFLTYDPRTALLQVRVPVLALNGGLDLQVDAEQNLTALKEALKEGGNLNVVVQELPGRNHLFQRAKTGLPMEYGQIGEAIDPEVLDLVRDWIQKETTQADAEHERTIRLKGSRESATSE